MKIYIIIFALLVISTESIRRRSKYEWHLTGIWNQCSQPCGIGEQTQIELCVKNTSYNTIERAHPGKCKNAVRHTKIRVCTNGKCPTNTSTTSFLWKTSDWSNCSRECGGTSYHRREVDCVLMTFGTKELLPSKLSQCDPKLEPPQFAACTAIDCPPTFVITKWLKCPISRDCKKTYRRRNVKCASALHNGTMAVISPSYCYQRRLRPPKSWEECYSDYAEQVCAEKNKNNGLKHITNMPVKIDIDNSEVHQMRQARKLKILVGQTAYVFSGTRIILVCPVSQFPRSYIIWKHNDDSFHYYRDKDSVKRSKGKKKNRKTNTNTMKKPIRVNRKGTLTILDFDSRIHGGTWYCQAGISNASVELKHEMRSTGFKNWLNRYANRNYGMASEEASNGQVNFIKPDSVMWMESAWSTCPNPCHNKSRQNEIQYQSRSVTCERVEAKYYKVIDDSQCSQPKPITKRKCIVTDKCPKWIIKNSNTDVCTNNCYDNGVALKNATVICSYLNTTVSNSFCDHLEKPHVPCSNRICKMKYIVGLWSQCSLSCSNTTSQGFKNRVLRCVWENNVQRTAGDKCNKAGLTRPELVTTCQVPKCILGCRDLSESCTKHPLKRCRSSLFMHFCCAYCHKT